MAAAATPLEQQERMTKNGLKHPSLHPHWMTEMQCVAYEPARPEMTSADVAELRERWTFLVEDYRELLSLSHGDFWCQLIFETSVLPSINSFLKAAPRPYDLFAPDIPADCSDLHDELHRLVFLLLLRMSTTHESKTDLITPSVFGDIIYENYIFDITKLLDICCLYGRANQKLVTKMIENIFKCQPNYKSDLSDWFGVMTKLFDKFRSECKFHAGSGSPQKLERIALRLGPKELMDRLFYASDVMSSLDEFFSIASFLAEDVLKSGFEQQIAQLFEDLGPHLKSEIKSCNFKKDSERQLCRRALRNFGERAVSAFRAVVFPACLAPLVEGSGEDCSRLVERFVSVMFSILSNRRFLALLDKKFSFEEDLHLIRQSNQGHHIDDAQVNFIRNAIESARGEFCPVPKKNTQPEPVPEPTPHPSLIIAEPPGLVYQGEPPCKAMDRDIAPPPHVLASLTAAVQDILPDLSDSFVQACLAAYDYCDERVVNAVLEDSLPDHLRTRDRSGTPVAAVRFEDFRPPERPSIFDGDEFDPSTGVPFDMTRVHKGKRDRERGAVSAEEKAQLVQSFGSVTEWEEVEPGDEELEYNDEYDDTYESNLVVVKDFRDATENRRPWVTPRALGGAGRVEEADDNAEEGEEEEDRAHKVSNGKRVEEEANGRRPSEGAERRYDVRGIARGRGQSAEVLKNRQFKDRHKARGANHNRRVLADKKRQRTGFY